MVNKGVLAKNYYIVPETVADYGTNIYNMMAETDQALEEASGIIGEISSLAERVPSQARCGILLEACASAQAEVRSVDFLSYGQRVKQGLQNLLDHNQYITSNFIKTMGTYTEKMRGFGMECRRLADLITYTTEYKEQINIIQSMTEVMRSMNGGNINADILNKGRVNENCNMMEAEVYDKEKNALNHGQDGYQNYNMDEWYINKLCEIGRISDGECNILQFLLTASDHVTGSARTVIMGILKERLSFIENTQDTNSLGYQWIQVNVFMLDTYMKDDEQYWSDLIKQIVLSEYYDTYVRDITLISAGAESVLDGNGLDWEKCQEIYNNLELWEIDDGYHVRNGWLSLYNGPTFEQPGYYGRNVAIIDSGHRMKWCSYEAGYPAGYSYINKEGYKQMVARDEDVIANILESNVIVNEEGRYWVAVGPNLINENYPQDGKVVADDFVYGTYIDIIVRDPDNDRTYYIPCVVGDIKNHTFDPEKPNGQYQTGVAYPESGDTRIGEKDYSYVEFICSEGPEENIMEGLNLEFVGAIVYEKEE